MPRIMPGRTGKLTGGMPLEDRLAMMLALKSTLTMQQAMHLTGIVAPAKDGDCGHQQGKAGDGRCLGCKREADQRTYRKKQYVKALAALVARGVAEAGTTPKGTQVWKYTGPSHAYVEPVLPNLPYDCDPDTVAHFRAASGRPPARRDGEPRYLASVLAAVLDSARNGNMGAHPACSVCMAAYAEAEAAHGDDSEAAQLARRGNRASNHYSCLFCIRIDEAADEARRLERAEERRAQREEAAETERVETLRARIGRWREARDNGRYAYEDGRRILRDGQLCDCGRCDERQERRRREAAAAAPQASTADAPWHTVSADSLRNLSSVYMTASNSSSPRWDWRDMTVREARNYVRDLNMTVREASPDIIPERIEIREDGGNDTDTPLRS